MRILLTGFEPFGGEKINPSQMLMERMRKRHPVETALLPVSYERSWQKLDEKLKLINPDFLLMLGQGSNRKSVCLERVALNWVESTAKDEDGQLQPLGFVEKEGPEAYISDLPLRQWSLGLKELNLPVDVSLSAGGFICNYVYYKSFHNWRFQAPTRRSLFVHVPYLPEQVFGKPEGTPFLTIDAMEHALDQILRKILSPPRTS